MSARSILRDFLKGRPNGPLFIPILFTIACKTLETPLNIFLRSPSRQVLSMRELQKFLNVDGVIASFDPLLEAEALGCKVDRSSRPPRVVYSPFREEGFERLHEIDPASIGRISTVVDVIKRMRLTFKDKVIISSITGPLMLAHQLTEDRLELDLLHRLIKFVGEFELKLTKLLCMAGVDLLLIIELDPTLISGIIFEDLKEALKPICNVSRYFEVLSTLMFVNGLDDSLLEKLIDLGPDCFVLNKVQDCVRLQRLLSERDKLVSLAVAIEDLLSLNREGLVKKLEATLHCMQKRCVFITTTWEVPFNADLRALNEGIMELRSFLRRVIMNT